MIFNETVMIGAKRTPHGLFGGSLKHMSATAITGILCEKIVQDLPKKDISQLMLGCVLSAGLGQSPARQVLLKAACADSTGGFMVNRVCGSGMLAVIMAGLYLQQGAEKIILAGGMENMSASPYLMHGRFGYKCGHQMLIDHLMKDGLEDAYSASAMGLLAEHLADKENFSRAQQDRYASMSAQRTLDAVKHKFFDSQVINLPLQKGTLTEDETLTKINLEKISSLRPAFKKEGTVTAANASGLADGASMIALSHRDFAEQKNLNVRAFLKGFHSFSGRPEDFMELPVYAAERLIKKLDWRKESVDLWEVNEAFSVVPLFFQKKLRIPDEKINIWGGALALGHPLGASGCRIIVNLLHALEHYGLQRGVAAICVGGGEGLAVAIERP